MSLGITYGRHWGALYMLANGSIAADVADGNFLGAQRVYKQINTAFFGGGPLEPKRFEDIFSLAIPQHPGIFEVHHAQTYVTIKKVTCWSEVFGFVEGIPLIGSAIAAIKVIGHSFGMLLSYFALKRAAKILNENAELANNFNDVFQAAVSYTVHQNALIGSALSLIPFVKPIVRLAQGIIFHRQAARAVQA